MSRSQFEADLASATSDLNALSFGYNCVQSALESKNIPSVFSMLAAVFSNMRHLEDFLEKYNKFFELIEEKFGLGSLTVARRVAGRFSQLKSDLAQIKTFASERKFRSTVALSRRAAKAIDLLLEDFGSICASSEKIDYSRLDSRCWKMIGLPGVHYRGKVFLSYPWRDKESARDSNEQMIRDWVKPLLDLLNVHAVTLRDHLMTQDAIDDKAKELIRDSDGIVAFYTKGDPIGNVEHELSLNDNIIAICSEVGAHGPSMRRSRWQLDFDRNQIGGLLMGLIRALKDKQLFRLVI